MKLRFNHNCLFFHYASKSDIYLAGLKLPHTLCFIFDQVATLLCLIMGGVILHLMKMHLHFLHPTITFSRPSPILEYFWKN